MTSDFVASISPPFGYITPFQGRWLDLAALAAVPHPRGVRNIFLKVLLLALTLVLGQQLDRFCALAVAMQLPRVFTLEKRSAGALFIAKKLYDSFRFAI
jgi:hypothetical protein